MKPTVALAISGFALIAVTYGLARFAWGLMLPDITRDIPFTPRVAGFIAACSFVAYCLASLGAAPLTQRIGPRYTACVASLCATLGLVLLAIATAPWLLAAGLFIAGLSAGLASPSLAAAVSRVISPDKQPQINTLINAGTGAGIILSVPILMLLPGGWRAACVAFAVCALACLYPALRYLPGRGEDDSRAPAAGGVQLRKMGRLLTVAFISGVASAAWWSFGPDVLRQHVKVDAQAASMLWLVSGGAGIIGAFTGPLADRIGLNRMYRISQLCMGVPLLALAFGEGFSPWLIPAVALCGAGYITLSGVLLVYGAAASEVPAAGVAAVFLLLAAGQVAGAMLFGAAYAGLGATTGLTLFCALSLLMALLLPGRSTTNVSRAAT